MSVIITSSSSLNNNHNHNFLLILSFLFLINKKINNNKRIVMGLLLSRTLASKFFYPLLFSKKVHNSDFFPQQLENMMCLVSPRTGRHLQRYEKGCRQVVGCVSLYLSLSFSCNLFFWGFLKIGFLMFGIEDDE
jgi:hypothetical protein